MSVLLRRFLKQRFFARQDERRLQWARVVDEVLGGSRTLEVIPSPDSEWHRRAAEETLLQRWRTASPEQQAQLKALFEHWGLRDWRWSYLRRGGKNVQAHSALVLALLRYEEVLPDLLELLPRGSTHTQIAIVYALEILGHASAIDNLIEFYAGQGTRQTRPILSALIKCGRKDPQRLLPYLQHSEPRVQTIVAAALAEVATAETIPSLVQAASDPEPEVRSKIARALGRTNDTTTADSLKMLAADPVWFVRLQAIGALAGLHLPDTLELFWKAAQDKHWKIREKALAALYQSYEDPLVLLNQMRTTVQDQYALSGLISLMERQGIVQDVINELGSPDAQSRKASQELVSELLQAGAFATTFHALQSHPTPEVRREILRLMSENASPAMRPPLQELVVSLPLDSPTRQGAEQLLARLEPAS